jgi:hypothetical protein
MAKWVKANKLFQPNLSATLAEFCTGSTTSNRNPVSVGTLLQATGLRLGSCYLVSPTRALNGDGNKDLAKEAGVPEGHAVQCAVIVGYAAAENKFSLGERKKKGAVNYID